MTDLILSPADLASAERKALHQLGLMAKRLLQEKVPPHIRTALIRTAALDERIPLRDGEIMAICATARRELQGRAGAVTETDEFDIPEEVWAWENVIAGQTPNLVVALQKVGKTALIAGLISAWHYGNGEFLGHKLHGPCPPVIIAGTDQTMADWRGVLAPAGLMDRNPENGKWRLTPNGPIRRLWHRSQPVYLDIPGIEDIATECEQYPGALFIADTYAALVAPLGLDEAKPEAAEPLYNLMEMIEPHQITPVLIHHASKSRVTSGPPTPRATATPFPQLYPKSSASNGLSPTKKVIHVSTSPPRAATPNQWI